MVSPRAILALLLPALAGCQCGFDSGSLIALGCTTNADCAPDQDCIEDTCAQRRCAAAAECGGDHVYDCDDDGYCVAEGCSTPEDCGDGFVCEDGFCTRGSADGGGLDASAPDAHVPDASAPDAAGEDASVPPDASIPDASIPDASADAAVDCLVDEDCDDEDLCTSGDACAGGRCVANPYSCDDGLACTADACDGLGGCSNTRDAASCVIDGACRQTGELGPDGCSVCAPGEDPYRFVLDCGACPDACGALEECLAARCAPAPFGTGADGDLVVALGDTKLIGAVATASTGSAGQRALDLASSDGFAVGQILLLHQSQGAGAGAWELARISSLAGGAATLAEPLQHAYASGGADHAQAVVVPQYRNVTVEGILTSPAWSGAAGGILAFLASGTVTVSGAVDMAGRGFRGASHACTYQCQTGFAGESSLGPGPVSQLANGAGGGAGTGGQDCGMGAGGGHGTAGGAGGNGTNVFGGCGLEPFGGEGGAIVGAGDLDEALFFGAAGGEGGADEDGAHPGAGGNGGGTVVIIGSAIGVTGAIDADGLRGADGDSAECGATGCGMGGGGGGAGGAIRILADTGDLGDGLVHATGGEPGLCTCGNGILTGAGGVGRIEATATVLTGTTNPP